MKYKVTITETLSRSVIVRAESPEDAEKYVQRLYRQGEIVLDGRDFDGAEPLETDEYHGDTEPDYDIL